MESYLFFFFSAAYQIYKFAEYGMGTKYTESSESQTQDIGIALIGMTIIKLKI